MSAMRTNESSTGSADSLGTLPEWPLRTIAVLATIGDAEPHAIPVSAPIRAGERRILLNLHRTRDSLRRLRQCPRVALTILAAENIAFTARGPAHIIQDPMSSAPEYVAISIDVEQIDDHRQPAFLVQAGPDRRWVDDAERAALGQRVHSLAELTTR